MRANDSEMEFDAKIYEHTKFTSPNAHDEGNIYDTGPLPYWINTDAISEQEIEDIRKSDTAFAMFINQIRERENLYQRAMHTAAKATKKLSKIEGKLKDRKLAVIIMTIAEIIISIGVGGMFTRYAIGFVFVVLVGIIMTILSLYINFRK